MVKYLQMDGVDDVLLSASVLFNEILIDFIPELPVADGNNPAGWRAYIDARSGLPTGYLARNDWGQVEWGANIKSVYVDGSSITHGAMNPIYDNVRHTLRVVFAITGTGDLSVLSQRNGNTPSKGKIYSVKFLNNGVVTANYDMSTGTVQDQSGNGRHATLTGGTWLDDGTGGGDTGTDGSITLGLTQQIYKDNSANLTLSQQIYKDSFTELSLRQEIYRDISTSLDLIQNIYRDTETLLGLNQSIYKGADTTLTLTQAIYRDSEINLTTRQEIYAEGQAILQLIQEFYEDSQTYITLQLIQEIYKDDSVDLPVTQTIYKDSEIVLPLRQEMYEEKAVGLTLNQNVYKDDNSVLDLTQTIYKDSFSSLPTVQRIYKEGEINLPILIQIRDDLLNLIGEIRLVGKRVLSVSLQGNRELNVMLKGGIGMTALNQNFSMIAGDTKSLIVNMPEELTGASVKWALKKKVHSTENELLKTTSSGISVSSTNITIKLDPADTLNLSGAYYHECEVTDQLNNVSTVFTGMCLINKSGI